MNKEISHAKLVIPKYVEGISSARNCPIGFTSVRTEIKKFLGIPYKKEKFEIELIDKVVKPINICPNCGSKNTFNKRIQDNKDIIGNVWRIDIQKDGCGQTYSKFDLCFDCSQEFLIEAFIWKRKKISQK